MGYICLKTFYLYNNDIFQLRNNDRYGLRFPNILIVPLTKSQQSELSIHYRGVFIWNDLPPLVRSASSLTSFKRLLKTHLFSHYQMLSI